MSYFSLVPNSSEILRSQCGMNQSTSVTDHDVQILISFVEILCPGKSSEILSDDVLNNDRLFNELKRIYDGTITRQKVTELRSKLAEVDNIKNDVATLLQKVGSIFVSSSKGTHVMAQSLLQKDQLLMRCAELIVIFHGKLKDRDILNGLRRRLKQNKGKEIEDITCRCMSTSLQSWSDAVEALIQKETCGIVKIGGALSYAQLNNIASLMQSELALLLTDLADFCEIHESKIVDQILLHLLVAITKEKQTILINLRELMLQLFGTSSSQNLQLSDNPVQSSPSSDNSSAQLSGCSKKVGRPSLVSKYPQIVPIIIEFIKQHGYRAQERRRTGIGTSYGVTLREIQEHLLKMIPELQGGLDLASQ